MSKLKKVIHGRGVCRGITYRQIRENDRGYIYECKHQKSETIYYEVIRKVVKNRFDWKTKTLLDESMEIYPSAEQFGSTAWTYMDLNRAEDKFSNI